MRLFAFAAAILLTTGPALADEANYWDLLQQMSGGGRYVASQRSAVKPDFVFPASGPVRIILFRPDVKVSEQSTGGLEQAKADWTETARAELTEALRMAQSQRTLDMKLMPDLSDADGRTMADYKRLFKTVADSAIRGQLFAQEALPTKTDGFSWTLGPGIQSLAKMGGGDYGLFLYSEDSYESNGRRNAELIERMMGRATSADVPVVGSHVGYAGLVDLSSGDLVWINIDVRGRGDVRTTKGAELRIAELLRGFPLRAGVLAKGGKL